MKVTNKNDDKNRNIKKKPIDKSKKQKVVVVAQEIKFARLLSGNEKKTRDRVLRALKKWLLNCFEKNYDFKEDDFTRVWKGLFYAVWMSDKPLVQEDLCESIAGILDLFPPEQLHGAMLLTRAGFKAIATEWFGIDQHRIDKFLMLVRRYLRASLRCVRRCSWSEDACRQFADMLSHKDGIFALKTPLYARNATSMALHIADCYLEEISKVSSGDISPDSLSILLSPFVSYLSLGSSPPLCIAARRVITDLIAYGAQEDDDEEMEAEEEAGENENSGDDEQVYDENGDEENSASDSEITEGPLDPRAGRVDVALRPLAVPAPALAALLRAALPRARAAALRRARRCLASLEQYMSGAAAPAPAGPAPPAPPRPARAARSLRALEKRLVAEGDELALRGLSRKHRKRLLAKSRTGHSIVDDVPDAKTDKHSNANGDWQVEETGEIKNTKKKRKQANKENVAEPKNKRQKLNTPQHENKDSIKVSKKKNNAAKSSVNNVKGKSAKDKIVKNGKDKKCLGVNVDVKANAKSIKISDVKQSKNEEAKSSELKESKVKEIKVNNMKDSKRQVKVIKNKSKELAKAKKINSIEAKLAVNKIKKFQKQDKANSSLNELATPKKVKFALKNNSMQGTLDYYKSVRQSPNIPFDSSKVPSKTNLKVNTPSPINPFFKKKMTRRASLAANIVF